MAKQKAVAEIVQRMFTGGIINMVAVKISCILEAKINWNYLNKVLVLSPFFPAISLIAVNLGRSLPFLYRCMLVANYKDLRQWNQSMIILFLIYRHGNNCAGVIAGKRNNDLCGVGIAYEANITGNN